MIRVLLVAREAGLKNVASEIEAIRRSGLDVTVISDNVTLADIIRAIESGDYEALWLAMHATQDGFVLDDGPMSMEQLASVARGRFTLIVLNTCDSLEAAIMMQNETTADIIATVRDVPDIDAYLTGALFAHWLARTENIAQAYQLAKPGGNRQYVHLAGSQPKVEQANDDRTPVTISGKFGDNARDVIIGQSVNVKR